MTLSTKIFPIIGGCLLAITFTFYVVSNALPSWGKLTSRGYVRTIGLWKICESTGINLNVCIDLICPDDEMDTKSFCDKVLVARTFVTLACILSAICALLLFTAVLLNENRKRIITIIVEVLGFLCLIMGIIGVAIAITVMTDFGTTIKLTWGASAILGIIAIIINFVGTVVSLFV